MTWQIDTSHSSITFSARHMMVSKTRGRFETFSGTVDFNEANPAASSVDVTIDVASLNTRDEKRDGHLRSPDFFDVAQYPTATFVSKVVEVTGENTGRIIGDLTIKGVTNEVALATEYLGKAKSPWGATTAGFTAETKINRVDWGLTWNVALETGGVLVGDEITLNIELELIEVAAETADAEAVAA
jgi:polyisoprenoid-binding protein YceI